MVLRDGRKVFEGPEAELLASKDPYVSKFTRRPRRPGRTTDGQATGVQQRDETGILGRLYSSEMPGRA